MFGAWNKFQFAALIFWWLCHSVGTTAGRTLMKTYTLRLALAFGFLVCLGRTITAQQLPKGPIFIQLSEIGRYAVSEWSLAKATDGAMLGLPYRNMKQSKVRMLVRYGTILHRSVLIMDGWRVIATGRLMGEYGSHLAYSKEEYGLCLGFDSAEEAQKVEAMVKLKPSIDELIRQQKSQLYDKRIWIY
jgi:hypothetical protein